MIRKDGLHHALGTFDIAWSPRVEKSH